MLNDYGYVKHELKWEKQKWEYKTISTGSEEWIPANLDVLGQQGWELVAIVPIARDKQTHSGATIQLIYAFKRPKP